MITKPNLETKKPVGNGITSPTYQNGESTLISTKSADTTNSSTDLNCSHDQTNLSAKFKTPNVSQNVPPEGQGQYQ